jgi:hypothetical protein
MFTYIYTVLIILSIIKYTGARALRHTRAHTHTHTHTHRERERERERERDTQTQMLNVI